MEKGQNTSYEFGFLADTNPIDLKISDITEDDDDIYTCTSTNWVGLMDNRRARLSVIVLISVSVSPTNIAVNSEEEVKVTCFAAGVPKPTVKWYKGENLLTNQNRVQVTDTELVISNVQASDSGYYQTNCGTIHAKLTKTTAQIMPGCI